MAGKRRRDDRDRPGGGRGGGRGGRGGRGGGRGGNNSYNNHNKPPRRGPPAIFVTCESGRERKAQREALELIHHYYYLGRAATTSNNDNKNCDDDDDVGKDDGANNGGIDATTTTAASAAIDTSCDEKTKKKDQQQSQEPLTLQEELAMLRKGVQAEEVLTYERGNATTTTNSKRLKTSSSTNNTTASMKSPFSIYDTGIRGLVCILCTLPQCELVPYQDILVEKRALLAALEEEEKKKNGNDGNDGVDGNESEKKSIDDVGNAGDNADGHNTKMENRNDENGKIDQDESVATSVTKSPLWDPVETVKCIMNGVISSNTDYHDDNNNNTDPNKSKNDTVPKKKSVSSPPPGSRFVTRMIPMQATCFASIDEIKPVTKALLQRYLLDDQSTTTLKGNDTAITTFKVDFKRRNCSHLSTNTVIEAITPMLMEDDSNNDNDNGNVLIAKDQKFSVNLTDPDFAIRIEVCKTLCGISILPREEWYKNFNLAELVGDASSEA